MLIEDLLTLIFESKDIIVRLNFVRACVSCMSCVRAAVRECGSEPKASSHSTLRAERRLQHSTHSTLSCMLPLLDALKCQV